MFNIRINGKNEVCAEICKNNYFISFKLSDEELEKINDSDIMSYVDFLKYRKSDQYLLDKDQYKKEYNIEDNEKSDAEKIKELYKLHSINIKNSAQKIADSLTDKYPKIEQDSWGDLSAEADNDGGLLLDSVTAGMSEEQRQEFIDTIKTKCVYFKAVRASLIRQRLIFSDQLESIKDDLKELEKFEVNYTLPDL